MHRLGRDGLALFIVTISMLILSWLTVGARCAIRWGNGSIGLDDWLMVAGLVIFSVTCFLVIIVCIHGAGYRSEHLDLHDITMGTKYYFMAQFAYFSGTVPIKLSICVALLRIAGVNRAFSLTLHAVGVLTVLSAVVSIIVTANICHPASALWGEAEGSCNYGMNSGVGYFFSAVSIVTDWTLAILPAFMVYKLQLKRSLKVSIATVLGLGAFASTATIVRLKFLVLYDDAPEFMYSIAKIAVWSILEEGIGITAGSLPMLRPLLRHIPFLSSGGRTSSDGHGGQANFNNTPEFPPTGRRGDGVELGTMNRVEGAETGPAGGNNSDGDSQRHILKETEFTISVELLQDSRQRG